MAAPEVIARPRSGYHGWRVVAACFVVATFAWGLGLFGASVYLEALVDARDWSVSLVSGAISVFYLVNALLLPAIGSSIDRHGARPVLVTGALALGCGLIGVAYSQQPWQAYLAFGVMGIGWASLSTTGISATLSPWFERLQGRALSIALMGASAGGILAVPALVFGIQRYGFEVTLVAVGVTAAVILVPLVTIVMRPKTPGTLGFGPDGDSIRKCEIAPTHVTAPMDRRAALVTRAWITIAGGFALALAIQIGFITHHVNLAAPLLGPAGAAALVSGAGAAAFGGRALLAVVADRLDVRKLAGGVLAGQAVCLLLMALVPTPAALIGGSLVFGAGIGIMTTLSPIIVRREFGATGFGAIYGAAALVIQLGIATGPIVFGALRDAFGDYQTALAVAAAVDVLAVCIILWGGNRPPPTSRA